LTTENQLLRSFALPAEPFRLKNGVLGFAFPRGVGKEITVVCPADYPSGAPTVFIKTAASAKPVRYTISQWSDDRRLVDLILPLLGPTDDNHDSNQNQKGESQ
jgi:hypothetical protein